MDLILCVSVYVYILLPSDPGIKSIRDVNRLPNPFRVLVSPPIAVLSFHSRRLGLSLILLADLSSAQ